MDERSQASDLIQRFNRFLRAGDLNEVALGELTVAQLRVLFRLRRRGPMTSGKLAASLGVTLPTVTSIIDRLVAKGLVERQDDPTDRRRVIVAISEDGAAIAERIQQGRRIRKARALEALSEDDLAALLKGLTALAAAADEIEATETPADESADVALGS